ncbi:MAG: prolipoprotein diacylglyceryl transferase [Lachnospiraceae bacterium]|nr:prolipoprotein diacylglyceryl transferase [Lachnospiraceae bacterium]
MSMGVNDIAFPNLHIYIRDVPKTFSIFGFEIALYGCIISFGMLLCVLLAAYDRRSRGLKEETLWDIAFFGIVFGIIGARIYYVIFAFEQYKNDPLSIFNLRQGGLAIYGGVIGGFLTSYIMCRIKKEDFLEFFDSVALAFPLGQCLGRWGNFFNREAFGGWYEGLFAMRLPIAAVRAGDISQGIRSHLQEGMDYIMVHPTFLYESAWNAAVLVLLFLYRKKKKFRGEIFCLYLMLYGLGRFWIEALRTDQLLLPVVKLPVSQCLALLCVLFSLAWEIKERKGKIA